MTAVVGAYGDGWKIRVTAAPERGRANDELIKFLSGLFGCDRRDVTVVSGASGRDKLVQVNGISVARAAEVLNAVAESS